MRNKYLFWILLSFVALLLTQPTITTQAADNKVISEEIILTPENDYIVEIANFDTIEPGDKIWVEWLGNWTIYADIESGYPITTGETNPGEQNEIEHEAKEDWARIYISVEPDIDTGLNGESVIVDISYNWNAQQVETPASTSSEYIDLISDPEEYDDPNALSVIIAMIFLFFGSVYLIHYRKLGIIKYLKLFWNNKFVDVIKGSVDQQNKINSNFCINCGSPVSDGDFCMKCGNKL